MALRAPELNTSRLFDSAALAAGYARDRPPVHGPVLERARQRLGLTAPVGCALDVGCGAGRSTEALLPLARTCIGVDPAGPMVRAATAHVVGASFVQGAAEQLPIADGACDLLAAAGSLAFADLPASLGETARVLAAGGVLITYDFGPAATPSDPLTAWWHAFHDRWPQPPAPTHVTSEALADGPLVVAVDERFTVPCQLDLDAYFAYVMTETNVAQAREQGTPFAEIHDWCAATLTPLFPAPRTVEYAAWLVCLVSPARELLLVGGRERRAIVIAPPASEWADRFATERERIAAALGHRARRIEHIGSTSVPGLAAKPIVDILVAVDDVADGYITAALVTAGYPLRVLEPDHRMFRTPARDVHVHLWREGRDDVRRHLLFRDWLRHDDADRSRYETEKRDLARREWDDTNDYADAKGPVIRAITERAEAWAGATAWSPPPPSG